MASGAHSPPEVLSSQVASQKQQEDDLGAKRFSDYIKFKHYTALTLLFASPVIIAIPPRRLNNLTALLVGAWIASSDHLLYEKTGRGIGSRIVSAFPSSSNHDSGDISMPTERARQVHAKLSEARDAQIRRYEEEKRLGNVSVSTELEKLKARQDKDSSEKGGWQKKRDEEEQQVFSEGKGYGELLKRYFRGAWPWAKSDSNKNEEEK